MLLFMKAKITFLSLMLCCLFPATSFAQIMQVVTQQDALAIAQTASDAVRLNDNHIYSDDTADAPVAESFLNMISAKKFIARNDIKKSVGDSEQSYKDVTLTEPGTLSDVAGSDIYGIDSIVVRGPINGSDFHTLWSASLDGRLSVINLENASIENETIPKHAFWDGKEQLSGPGIYVISLRKIILSDNIKVIGESAFVYAVHLESINIPSKLQELRRECFYECRALKSPLVFPKGVTEIPIQCFFNCEHLGEIILHSTIKHIGEGAFMQSKIKSINLPKGLLSIGNNAFYGSSFEELTIPASCQYIGKNAFAGNYELKKVSLNFGVRVIPEGFVSRAHWLKEVIIPESIEVIDRNAFEGCHELMDISLPEGLKEIKCDAFTNCKALKKLIFPSSLTFIESRQALQSLEAVYCKALIPPTCHDITFSGSPNDIPVYVPVGTSELYASATGWKHFTNFIETDDFSTSSIQEISFDNKDGDNDFYDLTGRRIVHPIPGQLYIHNGKKIIFQAGN